MKLRSGLGVCGSLLRRAARRLREVAGLSPIEATPTAADVSALRANVELLSERFEHWRVRFEVEQRSWQRLSTDEARDRERRTQEKLARLEALLELDVPKAPERSERFTLRPPPVPTGLAPAPHPTSKRGADTPPGPTVHGMFEMLGLSTLLGMLELERRSGVLKLVGYERTVELDLRRGAIVRARRGGVESEIVPALAEAFAWESAEFVFNPSSITADSDSPRSMDGLLLEVFRQYDEASRA